jgi:hypothetical protein
MVDEYIKTFVKVWNSLGGLDFKGQADARVNACAIILKHYYYSSQRSAGGNNLSKLATEKQKELMGRLKIDFSEGLTRKEASELIDAKLSSK